MSIDFKNQNGFSLIEVMVTLVVVSILVGIISTQFTVFNKLINRYSDHSLFRENYLVFLAILSKDFFESELCEQLEEGIIQFKLDLNFDSDYNDAAESIAYRWNKGRNRLERKSGKGNFQAILKGLEQLKWDFTNINQTTCIKFQTKSLFSSKTDVIDFCRPVFLN